MSIVLGFSLLGDMIPIQVVPTPLFSLAIPGGAAEEFCVEMGPAQTVFAELIMEESTEVLFEFQGDNCIDVNDCFPLVPYSFDPNGDEDSNVLDAVAMVQDITGAVLFSECEALAADGNQDGSVDVLDAVFVVNIIIGKENPP